MTKQRIIDAKDSYWVDLALHQPSLMQEPIRAMLFDKYKWLANIICVCSYCKASRLEDVTSNK